MMHNPALIFSLLLSLLLAGCGSNNGFSDLDRFMQEIDSKPRGRIKALPEVKVYRAFAYSAASRRFPFLPPADVVINEVEINPTNGAEYVELYNPTSQPIDISGWFISTSSIWKKFEIPSNTIIESESFLAFTHYAYWFKGLQK